MNTISGHVVYDNVTPICFLIPPKVNSHGILENKHHPRNFLTYTMPLLELQMSLIFITCYSIHYVLKRIGASLFVSCLIVGIIFGPSFLGRLNIMRTIFPHDSQDIINTIALFGYSMFWFLSAVKMDMGMILNTGQKALSIGVVSVMVPMIFSFAHNKILAKDFSTLEEFHGIWVIMIIISLTSFPVTAYVVCNQLKISNSELGRLGLSSALVSTMLAIFATVILDIFKGGKLERIAKNFIPIFGFLLVLVFILRPAMFWVIRQTPEQKPVDSSYVNIIMILAIASEAYFYIFHQNQFLGPFIFGLAVPAGAPLGSALVEKFEPFTVGVLWHVLVTTSMMRADIMLVISEFSKLKKYMVVMFIMTVVKLLSGLIPSIFSNIPLMDSVALSLIMNSQGIVELCLSVVFRDTKLISREVFALLALSILINATIIPILVKRLYNPSRKYSGYQIRNVMSLKPQSELKILACIHRPDNVDSVIRLIDASYPTQESPVSVHVLHLIKLVGGSTPVLISHSKQKPISKSSSQNIIHAFNLYEQNSWDTVSVQTFTAISSFQLMYEDICTLALDKLTSLILIPLHRKWSVHGMIECEDQNLRALNCKVLEKAPCSVGIFFDRGKLGRQNLKGSSSSKISTLSLCMIYFGGSDDREALTLAKRMAKNSFTSLTVIHIIAEGNCKIMESSEDKVLDKATVEKVKKIAATDELVVYKEYVVNDGPETIFIIRSMANEFDLFVIGRRYGVVLPQTAGLSEWSELPELGIIGDYFASKDLNTRASVLVVQQQKQIRRLE